MWFRFGSLILNFKTFKFFFIFFFRAESVGCVGSFRVFWDIVVEVVYIDGVYSGGFFGGGELRFG